MNMKLLFDTQRKLDEKIHEEKGLSLEETSDKRLLALLTELGELANEWRGFKYWSDRQSPKPMSQVVSKEKHPLLEEYVDCLHFILSIILERAIYLPNCYPSWQYRKPDHIEVSQDAVVSNFLSLFKQVEVIQYNKSEVQLSSLLGMFMMLGEKFGFSWEEVEEAYFDKNKVNYERLESGY